MASRTLLSSASRISSLLPTKDKLRGTEGVLLESTRLLLRESYQEQLSSGDFDVVTTSINSSVSFLDNHAFWDDMSRDNDITYYKVGRGRKGVDPVTSEEYAFETQKKGFRFCIPRTLVSLGEKKQFAGEMLLKALDELKFAKDQLKAPQSGSDTLLGATLFLEEDWLTTTGKEAFEYQLQQAGKKSPDVFCVEGCDDAEKLQQLKDIISRNQKQMVTLSTPNTTGRMILNDFETEIGFDIPTLVLREGQIDEIV